MFDTIMYLCVVAALGTANGAEAVWRAGFGVLSTRYGHSGLQRRYVILRPFVTSPCIVQYALFLFLSIYISLVVLLTSHNLSNT